MSTTYAIKWLKDKLGTKFFPVTHIKAVRDDDCIALDVLLGRKQNVLVSGTNIKTINNLSILGSGNITITGDSSGEANVIETIKVNNSALTPDENKAVNITIPTKVSDLTNDSGYTSNTGTLTGVKFNNVSASVSNGVASITATIPAEVTESTVSGWGFTKNTGTYSKPSGGIPKTDLASAVQTSLGKADSALLSETDPVFTASAASGITNSDISNWNSKTSNVGTITGIKMNGVSKGTSGVVDLGTVITAHLDISGKADKSSTVSTVTYDTTNKKITKTINGTTTDVVTAAKIVTDGGGITSHQDISGKADKATTLAGYGITDAKISNGVITLGSNTITPLTSFTESDPVFSASAAAGIQASDITNWNNKTSNTGTITGVSVNGTSVATSGVANITSIPASILNGAIKNGVTATTQASGDNSTKVATTAYVDTAIDNLPEPMIFKGSLGTGGTITSLPAAATANTGFTYKVITAGTYASKAAKVGDTFISDGNEWNLIPSGDEPSGTVTSITLSATSPISINSSAAITTSGSRTISHATSGVTAGTYTKVTVNATGHVTEGASLAASDIPNLSWSKITSDKPTTLSGYGITDAKIASGTITLGSNTITPLTANSTLDATKLSGTIPASCYTDTNDAVTQTATTTNSAYEILFSGTADNTNRTEGARKTSTLTYNPNSKALVTGGTVNGYTLAAASAKGVDTSVLVPNSTTTLPTSKAVADYISNHGVLKIWPNNSEQELTEDWATDGPIGLVQETSKSSLYILLEDSENYLAGSIFIWNNETSLYECIYDTSKDLVISAALNDLNDRLISKTESLESDIYKIIEDDEYVVAKAFANLPNDFVTRTSEQTISGIKTFENGWKLNNPVVNDVTLELIPPTETKGTYLLLVGSTRGLLLYNKTEGGTMALRSYGAVDIRNYATPDNKYNINIVTGVDSSHPANDIEAGTISIYNYSKVNGSPIATGMWVYPQIVTFFGATQSWKTPTPKGETFVNLFGMDLYFCTKESSAGNIKSAVFNWDGNNLLLRRRTYDSTTKDYPYSSLTFNITGDIIASGTITQGSDIRYKNVLNNIETSIESISELPLFYFKWKDERDTEIHIGTSAQEVLKLFPELVKEHNELSLDYASLGTTIGILLARKVSEYEKRIKDLEDKINLLKEN